jgi:hypothetical protein
LVESTLNNFEDISLWGEIDESEPFTEVALSVVDSGISFLLRTDKSITDLMDIVYFRPLSGTLEVVPSFSSQYMAVGPVS